MHIIKKSGNIEDFNNDKLFTSIYNASLDANTPLNQSDINVILEFITSNIKKIREDYTSSYEVFSLVLKALCHYRFQPIAKAYVSFLIKC